MEGLKTMNDQSGNTAQPWYDSEEHFATQLEGRLAQQLGRALLDATAAQIRGEMAQGRAAALGERVGALAVDVEDLKQQFDAGEVERKRLLARIDELETVAAEALSAELTPSTRKRQP
jgi:hypothetical protein